MQNYALRTESMEGGWQNVRDIADDQRSEMMACVAILV